MTLDILDTAQAAPPEPMTRHTGRLLVEGAEIHYEVCGQGPALVLAHGLGGNHMSWWQQVGHFQQGYTCVTFAHRGFGPSTVESGQPDPRCYAQDLAALLDHLQLDAVHLVGQSMGGWTVIEFCLHHPQRVRSLTLSATVGSLDLTQLRHLDPKDLDEWLQRTGQAVAKCHALQIHPAAGPRMAREQAALHRLYQFIDECPQGLDKALLRERLRAMRVRSPAELAATGIAVLILSPDEDLVIPPVALRALAAELPDARCITLPHTGHSPYFERAPVFNQCLGEFLQGIESRG